MTAHAIDSNTQHPLSELRVAVDLELLAQRVAAIVVERLEGSTSPTSPWLDVNGVASYLSCSPERVRKLVQRRAIPFHQERAGGRVFFHRKEIDEWLLSL